MNKTFIKVKEEDLENSELKGNFLFEENGEYYFSERLSNAFFEIDENAKDYEENPVTFDEYVEKFLKVCKNVKNNPSLLFVNYVPKQLAKIFGYDRNSKVNYNMIDIDDVEGAEEAIDNLNNKPCLSCVVTYIERIKDIFERRSEVTPKNDLYIFFNKPESYKELLGLPSLSTLAMVAKGRNIYFVFNIVDKHKFISLQGSEEYENLKANCLVKFICSKKGISDIEVFNTNLRGNE